MKLWRVFLFLGLSIFTGFSASTQTTDEDRLGPDSQPQPGVPKGELLKLGFDRSKIFPGTYRDYWVYAPAQYTPDKPACLYVNQDGVPVLFSGTIADNLRHGKPDASDAEIASAARAAFADGFIGRLPRGYETETGERGVQLSGGEKQRIAIARAFLKDAPILILDEPTSSLDAESEELIKEALARLLEGRTALIIAHRLSTIEHTDEVVVLEDGCVAERGRHEELRGRSESLYRRYAEQQLSIGRFS